MGHREDVFLGDVNRQDFLKTLAEACQKTGWQMHAYCLMCNHYHLLLETPNANLIAGMAWLQSMAAPEHQWIRVDRLLDEHGIGQDTPAGRQEFECRMEARRLEAQDEQGLKVFQRWWCVGG